MKDERGKGKKVKREKGEEKTSHHDPFPFTLFAFSPFFLSFL
jgi:hypothetical protein